MLRFVPRASRIVSRNVINRRTAIMEGAAAVKLGVVAVGAVAGWALYSSLSTGGVDYDAIRKDIAENYLDDMDWDDGSWGPVFIRLAWHASGTYCKTAGDGGSDGATQRFRPESHIGANAGLEHARRKLEPLKAKYPEISYADLWILAANTALEEMGCGKIPFTPGRTDAADGSTCPPDGRLPDGDKGASHVREIFGRMGLNDQEMVVLIGGGHAIGRCHTDRSGFDGPWTRAPTTFSNEYFREILDNTWSYRNWNGPKQFQDPTGDLMMLETEMSLRTDPEFRKYSEIYKNDYARFEKDFINAWVKLVNLGR